MKVKTEVQASRERPMRWGDGGQQEVSVRVAITIDASRGDPIVGTINAILDGAKKTAVESLRVAS